MLQDRIRRRMVLRMRVQRQDVVLRGPAQGFGLRRADGGVDSTFSMEPEEMAALFPDLPEAIANTEKIAARCKVDFEFGHLQLPYYPIPAPYADDEAYLRHLCEENLPRRYATVTEKIRERLGTLSGVFLIGYAFARMFSEMFREPETLTGTLVETTWGQWLSVPMLVYGLYLVWRGRRVAAA